MADPRVSQRLSGLYVVLDPSVHPGRSLTDVLRDAAKGGATLFQYRNKSASMKEAYAEALLLRKVAADLGVTFIVNDRCDLALAVDADGVHLGQTDLPYPYARQLMGQRKLIGLSTHNSEQVKEADGLKPDYIGFGPIFKPGSKPDHDPVVGIEGLRSIRALTRLPIFAIGGITVDQVGELLKAGANGVAVISAILKAPAVQPVVSDFVCRIPAPTSPTS
jgi:thiamine-phosphate pyrophosphorylase